MTSEYTVGVLAAFCLCLDSGLANTASPPRAAPARASSNREEDGVPGLIETEEEGEGLGRPALVCGRLTLSCCCCNGNGGVVPRE